MGCYEQFREAELLFALRDYQVAARRLERRLADVPDGTDDVRHGVSVARELLARASYHSAQLGRVETVGAPCTARGDQRSAA